MNNNEDVTNSVIGNQSSLLKLKYFLSTSLSVFIISFFSPMAFAQQGIDEFINNSVQPITSFISAIVFYSVSVFGTDIPLVVA